MLKGACVGSVSTPGTAAAFRRPVALPCVTRTRSYVRGLVLDARRRRCPAPLRACSRAGSFLMRAPCTSMRARFRRPPPPCTTPRTLNRMCAGSLSMPTAAASRHRPRTLKGACTGSFSMPGAAAAFRCPMPPPWPVRARLWERAQGWFTMPVSPAPSTATPRRRRRPAHAV
ncbi:hypothetical protein GGX14DRAFT_562530 [Mycena pura]|uniref:Uncharacterized protein n=1 Tax=Mycena pura TaxID=153505 RepID=A0AAD6YF22_9AGAR|nr:hypothetical protein GGX14DRAFT_562530 [Mycena pura]